MNEAGTQLSGNGAGNDRRLQFIEWSVDPRFEVAVKAAPSRTSNPPEQAKRSHTIELESGLLHQRPARGVARFREGRWYHSLVC
jgi:hypothetical protein